MAEVYVCLTAIALQTRTLRLGPGVTNPITRHPAVTAAACAALQSVSGGRVSLGIGRGDSALAYLGASPARLQTFERYVELVQRYLCGEAVPLADALPRVTGTVAGFEGLSMGHAPSASQLLWLDPKVPKVPVDVTATGPRALAMAGRLGDRVMLTLGADPARVRWGVEIARAAAARAGRDPAGLSFGTYMTVMPVSGNAAKLRDLIRPVVATGARFAIMDRQVLGPVSAHQREVLESLVDTYDMTRHTEAGQRAPSVDDAFIDSYAIVGSPAECVERLQALAELGLDRFVVGHLPITLPEHEEVHGRMVEEVLPELHGR
jgi:5,10-methylenetetrahydromethanopterin reductase